MNRSHCLRTTLVVCNVALLLIGGVALGTGVWVLVGHIDLMNYVDRQTSDIGALRTIGGCQLAIGVVAIVVAVVGFYQFRAPSKRLLEIYSGVAMASVGVVPLMVYIWTTSLPSDTDVYARMQQLLQSNYSSHLFAHAFGGTYEYSYENDETLAADIVQLKFGCCGVINGSDYSNATSWSRKVSGSNATMIIPATCCRMNGAAELSSILKLGTSGNLTLINNTCPFTSYDSNINTGCYYAVKGTLKMIVWLIFSIGVCAWSVQSVMSIVSLLFYRSEFKYKVMP